MSPPMLPPERLDETLLAPSQIRLFGRAFTALQINTDMLARAFGQEPGKSPFQNPMTDKLMPSYEPHLARIYGFSFEGNYHKMTAPAVFLVHGEGIEIATAFDEIELSQLGVEFKAQNFAKGVKMWSYDRSDMSIRVDLLSGMLQDILLAPEFAAAVSVTGGEVAPRNDFLGRAVDLVGRDGNIIGPGGMGRSRRG